MMEAEAIDTSMVLQDCLAVVIERVSGVANRSIPAETARATVQKLIDAGLLHFEATPKIADITRDFGDADEMAEALDDWIGDNEGYMHVAFSKACVQQAQAIAIMGALCACIEDETLMDVANISVEDMQAEGTVH